MYKRIVYCIIVLLNYSVPTYNQIRVVLTAALTDSYFELRKQQYIESMALLAGYGYTNVYVVEALKKKGPTFLDDYSCNVFYSQMNNPNLDHRNFGINEAKTLYEGLKYLNFDPEDMIVKMTGRVQLVSDNILKLVENNSMYDAFIKNVDYRGVHTVCFAIKYKYLLEWLEYIDYVAMERTMTTIEEEFFKYLTIKIKNNGLKVFFLKNLGMKHNLLGSTTLPGHSEIRWE